MNNLSRRKGFKLKCYSFSMHTLCSGNDVTEGSTQEAHMCASCVLPRRVDKMV